MLFVSAQGNSEIQVGLVNPSDEFASDNGAGAGTGFAIDLKTYGKESWNSFR
jgi:hypothetical protein